MLEIFNTVQDKCAKGKWAYAAHLRWHLLVTTNQKRKQP